MESMAYLWNYQQSIEELKHRLLCTTLELEAARMAAVEEKRRNDDYVKQLLQLLKVAFQERDEAKDQLQLLMNNLIQSNLSEHLNTLPYLQMESPLIVLSKGNSSIKESDSFSDHTHNHQSYVSISSPADSLLDAVTSPIFSNMNVTDSSNLLALNQPFPQEFKVLPSNVVSSSNEISCGMNQNSMDSAASAIIDHLVMNKPLPEKGKLLKSVMEAGPLLQTLLVAGPLPQWRNPPPVQPVKFLHIPIKQCEPSACIQKPVVCSTSSKSISNPSYQPNHNPASQFCSMSMLSFSSLDTSCMSKRAVLSYGCGDGLDPDLSVARKRQKFEY